MIIPRDYQAEAVQALWDYFHAGMDGNPLVLLPTGTGKSVVIALFLKRIIETYPDLKILILTHVKELVKQNHTKLIEIWPTAPAGIHSSGLRKRDTVHPIIFAGIGSVVKKPEKFGKVDLVLVDECHLVSNKSNTMYQKFFDALTLINPMLRVIGTTATDWRLSEGRLSDDDDGIFTDVVYDKTDVKGFNEFIEQYYLAPLVPKSTQTQYNLDAVRVRGGEFAQGQLQNAVNTEEINDAILKEVIEVAQNRYRWLIFATGIEHSINIAATLNDLGVRAKAVHSGNKDYKMSSVERDEIINEFKTGKITACVNNGILTTGFDCPDIDLIVMMRPTLSCGLWVQMLGRGTRPVYSHGPYDLTTLDGRRDSMQASHKHNCLVLDFAANTPRLGPINDPQKPHKEKKGNGNAVVKICPNCDGYVHARLRVCNHPDCGYEFPPEEAAELQLNTTAGTDELIKKVLPIYKNLAVDKISFQQHQKMGKPNSLRVNYGCGLTYITEYVCIQHGGMAQRNAERWVRSRIPNATESQLEYISSGLMTVDFLLELAETDQLQHPTHLRVEVNKKFPEIKSACFDGTCFNEQNVEDFQPNQLMGVESKQVIQVINNK